MKTIPIGPFLGLNNRLSDSSLIADHKTGASFLRTAENVDVDNAGRLRRRAGRTLVQAMTGAHSWFQRDETHGYLVRGAVLYSISLSGGYAESMLKILSTDDPVSFVSVGEDTYFSNGTDSGRINGSSVFPWALPCPVVPGLSLVGGTLLPGRYQVAITYCNTTTGEEGGSAGVSIIMLSGNSSGIRVALPGSANGVTHVNVYVSEPNGTSPYFHSTIPAGQGSVDISSVGTGRSLHNIFEAPMPAVTGLFIHMGRLCGRKGNTLYYGLPFRYGYCDPVAGTLPFAAEISVAIPCEDGVYVVADETRWIPGDIGEPDAPFSNVFPYGAVKDSQFSIIGENRVGWLGKHGFVIGSPQGQALASMWKTISMPELPARSVTYITRSRGYQQVFSCGWCMNVENSAVTTYSGIPFTSASGQYATLNDGLYRMEGATDGTQEIAATVGFGRRDFGSDALKRLPYCYLGVSSDVPLQLNVQWTGRRNEMQDAVFTARFGGESLSLQRIELGRGIEATWFDLELHNQFGADFTLATVSFIPCKSTRRI